MQDSISYSIRKLAPTDSVNSFKSGDQAFTPLKTFLKKHALSFQESHVAQTYVAVNNECSVLGFITITCSEVDLRNGYEIEDCEHANNYDSLPAIKIARLAVDSRYRYPHLKKSINIGQNLVSHVLGIAIDKIAPAIGCRFIIADAKQQAVQFYIKQGFTLLDTEGNKNSEEPIMFFDLKLCLD